MNHETPRPGSTLSNPNSPDLHDPAVRSSLQRYWRSNVRLTLLLLLIWATVGLGCGVLLADFLNAFRLPGTGYPLGFWFAQQGSILVFVILIGIYCWSMNRLDTKHHKELERLQDRQESQS